MIILHFLLSTLFVLLFTISLILVYFLLIRLFIFIKNLKRKIFKQEITSTKITLTNIWTKRIFLFFLVLNFTIYIQQLYHWNGKGSAYNSAKCYYSAGNVVAAYRSFIAPVFSPNNPLTFWLVIPQRILYNIASPLIPKDDGERAIWTFHWFVYPFAKTFTMPHYQLESDTNPIFRKKGQIATFIWQFIQAVQKDNFKDKNMREQHALRDISLAVLYLDEMYNHGKVYPTIFVTKEVEEIIAKKEIVYNPWQQGKITSKYLTQEKKDWYKKRFDKNWLIVQKLYFIATTAYETLNALESKWQESSFMSQELKKHRTIEATRKAAMIVMLQGGALNFKFQKEEMSCIHPYALHYIQLRKELKEMDTGNRLIHNLTSRYLYGHTGAEWMKYIFDKYCGYNLVGGYDTQFGTGSSRYENMEKTIQYGYILIKDIDKQLKSGLKGLSKFQLVRNANGIVTDPNTQLQWQDELEVTKEYAIQENDDIGREIFMQRYLYRGSDASKYCQSLTLGGYNDWRVPNLKELLSLVNNSKSNLFIKDGFKNAFPSFYWSSNKSTKIGYREAKYQWGVNFRTGYVQTKDDFTADADIRCVRGEEKMKITKDEALLLKQIDEGKSDVN